MARLRGPLGWLAAALVACAAVAFAYLPPRGTAREPSGTMPGLMTGPPTAERLRANELAKEWRRAALDVQLHEWRRRLGPQLERLRAASRPTFVTAIDSAWPPVVQERARRELDNAWRALELGTTKIGVVVVVEAERVAPSAAAGTSHAYLLPDSADRHTCVAWTAPRPVLAASFERRDARAEGWHAEWARSVLGACAFYARFGRPSAAIERWLAERQHRYTQFPAWDTTWDALSRSAERNWLRPTASRRDRAEREARMRRTYPAVVLGCLAGRAATCRAAAAGAGQAFGPAPRLVLRTSEFEADLPGSTRLLTDAVRDFGGVRVARFWTSTLPPDSAFHLAMDTMLGDWVLARQRAYGTTLVAGPTTPWGAGLFGVGVAGLGLLAAIVMARRRQVS